MKFDTAVGSQYSVLAGGVFLFNLIVGIGAVTMPQGLQAAGVGLGTIVLLLIGFASFMTATWVVEALAIANALFSFLQTSEKSVEGSLNLDPHDDNDSNQLSYYGFSAAETDHLLPSSSLLPSDDGTDSEEADLPSERLLEGASGSSDGSGWATLPERDGYTVNPLAVYSRAHHWWYVPTGLESRFRIRRRFEFGTMSELFFGVWVQRLFYLVLAIYLFGDLAIYAVSVPVSLAQVTGGWGGIDANDVYYLYLAIFAGLAVPFCFFDFQKTTAYQVSTALLRNVTILIMIVLAFIFIGNGKGAPPADVPVFQIKGFPQLFGVAIYSFMCHHSLPSLLTPIREKRYLTSLVFGVMSFIFLLYNVLDYSAIFAFNDQSNGSCTPEKKSWACAIQGLYPLNFVNYPVRAVGIFVALYPVFTVSGNYVLIAITLRNNLQQLCSGIGVFAEGSKYPRLHKYQRHLWSAVSSVPPFAIAFITREASLLVNITGAYAGLFIMLIFPAILVLKGREIVANHPDLSDTWNRHQSPFLHRSWAYFILVLAAVLFFYTLADDIYKLAT